MNRNPSANWEVALALPLGVVDNHLRKVEEQLRLVNMKALEFSTEYENKALRRLIDARLEHINEALSTIATLLSDIDSDIQPRAAIATRSSHEDERMLGDTHTPDACLPEYSGRALVDSTRKPAPEQDD